MDRETRSNLVCIISESGIKQKISMDFTVRSNTVISSYKNKEQIQKHESIIGNSSG